MKKTFLAIGAMLALAMAPLANAAVAVSVASVDAAKSIAFAGFHVLTNYMASVGFILYDVDPQMMTQIKGLADKQVELLATQKELKGFIEKADKEIENSKSISAETKAAIEKLAAKCSELADKCMSLEQKLTAQNDSRIEVVKSLGDMFTESEMFKAMQKARSGSASVDVGNAFSKTAIINATGQNQPLVPDMRVPGIINNPNRRLTIRDLLPVGRTSSNLVQFTRELVFTNSAGPQYDSPARENVTKPESGITFELANAAVVTLAHWIPVSKQVLEDAPMLQSYINGRLMYGLKLEEEDQLLNGDGTGSNISGLLDSGNNTAYNRAVSGDTNIDTLRRAMTQGALSEYTMDAVVLNPVDWEAIELEKATDGQYIWANPAITAGPQLWGMRVVATNAIAAGTFLVGAFSMGAQIWDREEARLLLSFENSDNFVKNMATLLAEERLALTVYRPSAFIKGTF
jgi:HK97 family phage major capsid protein